MSEQLPDQICGIIVGGIWHNPIACAFPKDHKGEHSWANIPQFAPTKKLAKQPHKPPYAPKDERADKF